MTTLNVRDAALLELLGSEANRNVVRLALIGSCSAVPSQLCQILAMTIRYVPSADGLTVIDTATGLTWQQAGSSKGLDEKAASAHIANLNETAHGGFSDWRLPTDHELCSIVDRDRYNPAIDPVFSCKSEWYRTSKALASSSGHVWFVSFYNGGVNYLHRNSSAFVRAVRGPSPAGQ